MGEVYVNLQQARRQAGDHSRPYIEEVKRLTVHGILHLLGYRDRRATDRRKMWARQEGYL
jgi:probable rRNA maturation factor